MITDGFLQEGETYYARYVDGFSDNVEVFGPVQLSRICILDKDVTKPWNPKCGHGPYDFSA